MSYGYRWPSRSIQQPVQGAVGQHGSEAAVTRPKVVTNRYAPPAGREMQYPDQGYQSTLNANIRPTTTSNPSAAAQLQASAQPRPVMAMQLYRPVSPPSSPPHRPQAPPSWDPMMEVSSHRVSPPPGFPAKQVSRPTNKEVPLTLRLHIPASPTSATRPREIVSSPPPKPAAAMPSQPRQVSQVRRSSVSPRNRCICQRAYCKVLCSICKQTRKGRVRLQCPQHPHTIHLMDYDCCPNCKAVNLTEVELRPN